MNTTGFGENERFLSVVIPAYNEATTLPKIIGKLLALENILEIIIVDDCSTDGTGAIAKTLAESTSNVSYFRMESNQGKTAALKIGFALTTGAIVIVQDADLEYDPAEIHDVIYPITTGDADVVFGSRFMVKRATRVLYFYHYLANKLLTFTSNALTNLNLSDVETGYKAFRGEIIRNMTISSKGFGFEIEVTAKVAKLGCSIYEVPISYYGRTYQDGKKIGFTDGVAAFWYTIRYNLFCRLRSSYKQMPQLGSVAQIEPQKESQEV